MNAKTNNPFNITFGEEPNTIIKRSNEYEEIVELFEAEYAESKVKIIVGPRGSGKTVLLTKVKEYFDQQDNWVTVDLIQYSNMLEQLAGKLYENGKIKKLFIKKEFNFSFKGISFSIKGENPISNVESLLDRILAYIKSKGKRVLVTIDDVAPNDYTKQFIQAYQGYIREKYPIYLLMTGLFENVNDLQNTNNLTFLLRAPKVYISKLNFRAIAFEYQKYLDVSDEEAIELAKFTKGYAYAFQLVGNVLYKNQKNKLDEETLNLIDLELESNVYGKIWESLSPTDKEVLFALLNNRAVKDILIATHMKNGKFQVYRKRLINMGVVDETIRGMLSFNLPRFKEFVQFQKQLLD